MRSKPNILWICTDQQRFDTLGCYCEFYNANACDNGSNEYPASATMIRTDR